MTSNLTTIVGTQWGDEGKGKITDYFAAQSDYVVRFHGGNNAGHTLVVGGETYKLHLIPSGVLYKDVISVIGSGTVINPKVLLEEIDGLRNRGIKPNLKLSVRAHVIMPYHILMDIALSEHQGKLAAGSTKNGIAPVCADKMYRHGIRIGDLVENKLFREKLRKSFKFSCQILKNVFKIKHKLNFDKVYKEYLEYGERLRPFMADTEMGLYNAYKNGRRILFEGAQGMSLDIDHGVYPHTTSTNNVAGYINIGSGVNYNTAARVIGVTKAYVSRVGISPFITELMGDFAAMLRDKGCEYGTTTGRPRRVGWLDLVQIRQSVRLSGLTELAMTKLDILAGFEEVKICTSYNINGALVRQMPASLSQLRNAKPVYKTFPGWPELTDDEYKEIVEEGYSHLPNEMKNFLEFIENDVDCPINIISLGPDRRQTLLRTQYVN